MRIRRGRQRILVQYLSQHMLDPAPACLDGLHDLGIYSKSITYMIKKRSETVGSYGK